MSRVKAVQEFKENLTLDDMIILVQAKYEEDIFDVATNHGVWKAIYFNKGIKPLFNSLLWAIPWIPNFTLYKFGEMLLYESPEKKPWWFKGKDGEWEHFYNEIFYKHISKQKKQAAEFEKMPYYELVDMVRKIHSNIRLYDESHVSWQHFPSEEHVRALLALIACENEDKRSLAGNLRYFSGKVKKDIIYSEQEYERSKVEAHVAKTVKEKNQTKSAGANKTNLSSKKAVAPKKNKSRGAAIKPWNGESAYAKLLETRNEFFDSLDQTYGLDKLSKQGFPRHEQFDRVINSLQENYSVLQHMIRIELCEAALNLKNHSFVEDYSLSQLLMLDLGKSAYDKGLIDGDCNINYVAARNYYGLGNIRDINVQFRSLRKQFDSYMSIRKKAAILTAGGEIVTAKTLNELLDETRVFVLPLKLNSKHDQNNAFVTIMVSEKDEYSAKTEVRNLLLEAYKKFALIENGQKTPWIVTTINGDKNENAITLHIKGKYAYGLLKGEDISYGIHLINYNKYNTKVRILVEPEIERTEYRLDKKDLDWNPIQSNGSRGGENAHKKGAIQLVHKPTHIFVEVATRDLSISQKREYALELLRTKVQAHYASLEEPREKKMADNILRKYVIENGTCIGIYGHRLGDSNYFNGDARDVMQGNLMPFIFSYHGL